MNGNELTLANNQVSIASAKASLVARGLAIKVFELSTTEQGTTDYLRQLQQKAEAGDAESQYTLGWLFSGDDDLPEYLAS